MGLRVLSISESGALNEMAWQVLEARGVTIERLRLADLRRDVPASGVASKLARYLPPPSVLDPIRRAAERLDPNLVHIGPGRSVALAALRALGGRRGLPMAMEQGAIGGLNLLSPIEWATFFSRRISKVVVPSYGQLNQWMGRPFLVAALGAGKVEVIHHPYSVPARTDRAHRDALRDSLDLPRDAFIVGTVCRLRPIKNVAFLARAVAAMRHDAICAVVGPGDEADLRDVRRAGGDRVRFLGRQPGAATIPAFDCYGTSTRNPGEAFGLATIEAMAAAVPVLATNVGGSGDLVRGRATGYSLPLKEADWTIALEALASDEALRARLGEAARLRVETEFSPETVADQTLSVWTRMAESRHSL